MCYLNIKGRLFARMKYWIHLAINSISNSNTSHTLPTSNPARNTEYPVLPTSYTMSLYSAAHVDPQGPGDSRPTALQVVRDNHMENKLRGRSIVITGVSSGLGIETARALKVTGANLFLTARDAAKAKAALMEIWDDKMHIITMDQNSLQSVKKAAEGILAKTDAVHILVNNAGVMAVPELQLSQDGYESHFAINHLSHFLLFQLLEPAMLKATSPEFQSRVVIVSAAAHRVGPIAALGDYNFEKTSYDPWLAYARSKTANTYMANEIERRYSSVGIHSNSLHPGVVPTGIAKYLSAELIEAISQQQAKTAKSPAQGAATTLCAAIGKEWEGRGGIYLNDCVAAEAGEFDGDHSKVTYVDHTYDVEAAMRLWNDSLTLVNNFTNV